MVVIGGQVILRVGVLPVRGVLLRKRVTGRVRALMLLRCWRWWMSLRVMLLVDDARGPRMVQLRRRMTLLVLCRMLHGENPH